MKQLLFSFILFWWMPGHAGSFQPVPFVKSILPATAEKGCTLPALTGFKLVSTGTTYFNFQWDPVVGAAYYRVIAYDAVNGAMVHNSLQIAKSGINTTKIEDLISGVSYKVQVKPVCANGQESM